MQQIQLRHAVAGEVSEMRSFLMEHGPNDWNHLPEDGVAAELRDVAEGKAIALLVEIDMKLVGFAIAYPGFNRFPEYTSPNTSATVVGYIGDVVVHKDYAGKGIGSTLLEETKGALLERGVLEVSIDCHEENKASRGMMRKAGFKELALYFDPERRSIGSRRSWVGRCSLQK